jgi:hypothetical protein
MFGIANTGPKGNELHYWTGTELWDVDPETAVRFPEEAGAAATLEMLRKFLPGLSRTASVVELPDA